MNESLVERIAALLPQTQCRRCGYPDCAAYAGAVAAGATAINRCPPGGTVTINRLAELLNLTPLALDRDCGDEAPRRVAFVDEAWCIGCTLCIAACPVDAIVGAAKRMHAIIEARCTGCELCVAPCPVECIHMEAARSGPLEPVQWLRERALPAKHHYTARQQRLASAPAAAIAASPSAAARTRAALLLEARQDATHEGTAQVAERKRLISEAVARSKARRKGLSA